MSLTRSSASEKHESELTSFSDFDCDGSITVEFDSQIHRESLGSFDTDRHSIASTNNASLFGSELSVTY
jgi:hypothetical protein